MKYDMNVGKSDTIQTEWATGYIWIKNGMDVCMHIADILNKTHTLMLSFILQKCNSGKEWVHYISSDT